MSALSPQTVRLVPRGQLWGGSMIRSTIFDRRSGPLRIQGFREV